jgi:hypothetical protein
MLDVCPAQLPNYLMVLGNAPPNLPVLALLAQYQVGLGTEFRSEKIPRNRLGMISVIPRKKAFIPRHSEFRGRANSEARNGTEWNSAEKISFTKQQQNNIIK